MMLIRNTITLVLVGLIPSVLGYGSGAPVRICPDMTPRHHTDPQTSSSPYTISVQGHEINPGQSLKISLRGNEEGRVFKGFFVQVRTLDGNDTIGSFDEGAVWQTLDCFDKSKSGITHVSKTEKTELTALWTSPVDFRGKASAWATFVENGKTFWVNVTSDVFEISGEAIKTEPTAQTPFISAYDGCFESKGCFGGPDGCIASRNCKHMVTYVASENGLGVDFEMVGQTRGWIAIGFSRDNLMGEDAVTACTVNGSNNRVDVFQSWNVPNNKDNVPLDDVIDQAVANEKPGLGLKQGLSNIRTEYQDVRMDKHLSNPFASAQAADLKDISEIGLASDLLIKLHGSLMIAAWVGTVGVAIFLARYFKNVWPAQKHCGQKIWFTWHRILNIFTLSLNVTAFVLIFVHIQGWSQVWRYNPHPILGVVVTLLVLVQPLMAAFRCHPGTPKRSIFNWFHFLVGNGAHILAVITLFFAKTLSKAKLPDFYMWILIAFVVFHVVVFFVMESFTCFHGNKIRDNQIALKDMSSGNAFTMAAADVSKTVGSRFRKILLLLYVFGNVGFVVALIATVFLSPVFDRRSVRVVSGRVLEMVKLERVAILILVCVDAVYGRPDGAPIDACMNMIPNHQGIEPLSISAPFVVVTDKTSVAPGETLIVSLATIPDKFRYFKGFLVVAVTPDNFLNKIGTFATNHEKYVACGTSAYSAVTHSSSQPKSHVEINWTAPKGFEGSVVFIATFVENFGNFWIGQRSSLIRVSSGGVRPTKHEPVPVPVTQVSNHISTKSHVDLLSSNQHDVMTNAVYNVVDDHHRSSDDIYEGCRVSKGCYGEPVGCTSSRNCVALVTFRRKDENIAFDLMGPAGGWIAVGFSKDRSMGDDSVVECVENQRTGVVDVFTSFNRGRSNSRLQLAKAALLDTEGASLDGKIACSFTRLGNVAVEGTSYDLVNQPHYLFLARGPVSGGELRQHSTIPYRSDRPVDLASISMVSGEKDTLIFVHACLMILAWVGTASVAVFMARFYKYTWVARLECGEQVWFTWHRALNIATISLTTLGIVIIFVFVGGWSSTWRENPHPVVGLLTFLFMWIQPVSAILRPHPGTPKRPIFNWFHFIVGNGTKFLALIALFLADKLQKVSLLNSFSGVLITYVVFEFGCYLIVEVYSCIKAHSAREQIPLKEVQLPPTLNPENAAQKNVDAPGSKFRKLFFCIHTIGVAALTLTLIIIVASSSERYLQKK
uniref:Ferric-chelate reductase 1 n=1 Tax=Strigamia maritima TaxID=126957 RepID=T1JGZ2_STRMM